jgi:hypothetical protein
MKGGKWRYVDWAEWTTAILFSLVFVFLLSVRAQHAGALWRDECATVQLSQMPAISDVLKNFQRESFPAVLPLTIRAYTAVCGTSDAAFRAFGVIVGVLLLIVVWLNARLLAGSLPLLALPLFGLNASFLIWGTGIRGYGIGSVAALLAFGLIGRLLIGTDKGRILAALLAALFCVQVLLYNSFLVGACTAAVVIVSLLRREIRPAIAALLIGGVCAASMLPYIGPFHYENQSTIVLQGPVHLGSLWARFGVALGEPARLMIPLWLAISLAVTVGAVLRLYRSRLIKPRSEWDLLLYGLLGGALSIVLYFAFLKYIRYNAREWYYLALIALLAGVIDLLGALLARTGWARLARLAVALSALVSLPVLTWPKVLERQTNIDLIAQKLAAEAQPNDLIICNPWYLGVSFNWYYHGRAPWRTWPDMEDHRFHRFDLLKNKMMSPTPIDDVRQMVADTLRSNNRVWVVGGAIFLKENEIPILLAPAPTTEFGWNCDAYADSWSEVLGSLFLAHAATGGYVENPAAGPVNELENIPLLVAQGWLDKP